MKSKSSLPTMKDVAAEAGVALGTVSKVFNGIPVGESYRLKVENAAKKLGYQVNSYARGMRTNKTNTIAIIMPLINHPYFAGLTEAICRELVDNGYSAYKLRSPKNDSGYDAYGIATDRGDVSYYNVTYCSVLPALYMELSAE